MEEKKEKVANIINEALGTEYAEDELAEILGGIEKEFLGSSQERFLLLCDCGNAYLAMKKVPEVFSPASMAIGYIFGIMKERNKNERDSFVKDFEKMMNR